MKIIIDCRFWGIRHTGLGRYTQNLVENLLVIDKQNQYFLLVRDKILFDNLSWKQFNNLKIIPADLLPYSFKEQIILPSLLNKVKPDLIHFPHFNIPFFCPFPYIVTIHDLIKHYSKGLDTTTRHPWTYLFKYFGYKTVFSLAVKKAKKIIVPSYGVKKDLLKHYQLDQEKIKVIYEGIDNKLKTLVYAKPACRSDRQNSRLHQACLPVRQGFGGQAKLFVKYKIKKPYLLYLGNAYPHKNLRRLILALKMINQFLANKNQSLINLIIIGARDIFAQRIKKVICEFKAEKYIFQTGFISDEDLKIIFSQAKALVNPSLMEGFGLPGLEAMANCCPVVCSNIEVFKEIYHQAAIYFDPLEIEDIKEKILQVINFSESERNTLIKKGLNQADKYSWQKNAQATLKIYQEYLQ